MSNLTYTQLGQNYRRAQGFSNFNSRSVVFYTVYFSPKTETFFDDYTANKANNEFSQILQTIAFAGIELYFIGEPALSMAFGDPAFIIGVNTDTSNMGDADIGMGIIGALNLTSALSNAGWMNIVMKNIVDHDSIHSPLIGG